MADQPPPSLEHKMEAQYNVEQIAGNTIAQQKLGIGQGVSGAGGISQSFTRNEGSHSSKVVEFSHTYIHFLGPGTDSTGAVIESNDDNQLCFAYDWGASFLPYNFSRAAVKPHHMMPYFERCNSYKMLGHKAVCTDLICSRDEIQPDGRTVSTPQMDSIEIFQDTLGKFRPNNVKPVGSRSLFECNKGFREIEPDSIEDGMLPRCKIILPAEQYPSVKHESLKDMKYRCFDIYNGLFTVSHWMPGTDFTVEHKFDSGRIGFFCWYGQSPL